MGDFCYGFNRRVELGIEVDLWGCEWIEGSVDRILDVNYMYCATSRRDL